MKVYEYKAFPNPWRVRIALAEKGLTDRVEFVQVDVPQGEHKQPAFLVKNPAGAVPLLELDDGIFIAECTAITEYFDHLMGEPTLTGKTATERAVIHMMQRRVEANLLDAIANYFHHATPGLGFEAYQVKEWGEKQKEQAISTLT
jgi:glutathione S-transferase